MPVSGAVCGAQALRVRALAGPSVRPTAAAVEISFPAAAVGRSAGSVDVALPPVDSAAPAPAPLVLQRDVGALTSTCMTAE